MGQSASRYTTLKIGVITIGIRSRRGAGNARARFEGKYSVDVRGDCRASRTRPVFIRVIGRVDGVFV